MNCKRCKAPCIKNGFQYNGKQRYYCKTCQLNQQQDYSYKAYFQDIDENIHKLKMNSCGITDISRVLGISRNTVSNRILSIANKIKKTNLIESFQNYEMDELLTHVNGKQYWVIYAINRKTKTVVDFMVGRRTKDNLSQLVNKLLLLNPQRIYTDGLKSYKYVIPKHIHNHQRYQTNRIERYNLNLRTHLKRLNRKTICYSKRIEMLTAVLKIYFWDNQLKF